MRRVLSKRSQQLVNSTRIITLLLISSFYCSGSPVDLGGAFLSGATAENPCWRLAEELGIERVEMDYIDTDLYDGITGEKHTQEEVAAALQVYLQVHKLCI